MNGFRPPPPAGGRRANSRAAWVLAICCLASGVLAFVPLVGLWLVSMLLWSPGSASSTFDDFSPGYVATASMLLLALAAVPAVVAALILRRRAGWTKLWCAGVTIAFAVLTISVFTLTVGFY